MYILRQARVPACILTFMLTLTVLLSHCQPGLTYTRAASAPVSGREVALPGLPPQAAVVFVKGGSAASNEFIRALSRLVRSGVHFIEWIVVSEDDPFWTEPFLFGLDTVRTVHDEAGRWAIAFGCRVYPSVFLVRQGRVEYSHAGYIPPYEAWFKQVLETFSRGQDIPQHLRHNVLMEGEPAPEIALPSLAGRVWRSPGRASSDSVLLYLFVTPGCPSCHEAMAFIKANERKIRNVQVVTVFTGAADVASKEAQRLRLPGVALVDADFSVYLRCGIYETPTLALVRGDTVVYANTGWSAGSGDRLLDAISRVR